MSSQAVEEGEDLVGGLVATRTRGDRAVRARAFSLMLMSTWT